MTRFIKTKKNMNVINKNEIVINTENEKENMII
jgi:hypothetical protein